MGNLLNKMFWIMVRPGVPTSSTKNSRVEIALGQLYVKTGSETPNSMANYTPVFTPTTTNPNYSTYDLLNRVNHYDKDAWLLFGMYSSYSLAIARLKEVVYKYSTENVMLVKGVPFGVQIIPNR